MTRTVLALLLLSIGGAAPTIAGAASSSVDVSRLPRIGQVDPRYQSYNVEIAEVVGGRFWAPYPKPGQTAEPENRQASGGLALEARLFRKRPPADLANRRLVNLARALGPAYVRVSGSWANSLFFQDDDRPALPKPPAGFQNLLTRPLWDGVVGFARAVDGRIVTSFAASAGARDATGAWSPDEARKLLGYTRRIGGHVYAAELINEPNLGTVSGLPAGYDARAFARDQAIFRAFVAREAPGLLTVGPGSSGETGVSLFSNRALSSEAMLSAEPRPGFDIFSYHFYGGRSQRCAAMAPKSAALPEIALTEEWLGRTDTAFAFYKDLRDRYAPGAPIWLGETAQASCGGDAWAVTFRDSFRYVDQLGRLARRGAVVIFHNTLAASDYGLIDETTLAPRPNYWAALLWRRVMGEVVLDAGPIRPGLHLYAHCLRGRRGGVALAAINLDETAPASLTLARRAERYTLTADALTSETVRLNGRPLGLNGDALPAIRPAADGPGMLTLPPASISFIAVPSASSAACG